MLENFLAEAGWEDDRFRVMVVGAEKRDSNGADQGFQAALLDLSPYLEILAVPSTFGMIAIARAIILRFNFIFSFNKKFQFRFFFFLVFLKFLNK